MVEEFFLKLEVLLTRRSRPTDHECMLWAGTLDKWGYGTIKLRMPDGKRRHSTAHRAAYMLNHHIIDIEKYNKTGSRLEVSHLCHCKSCLNPDHLVLEPGPTNLERKMCKKSGVCIGHNPECMLQVRSINPSYFNNYFVKVKLHINDKREQLRPLIKHSIS